MENTEGDQEMWGCSLSNTCQIVCTVPVWVAWGSHKCWGFLPKNVSYGMKNYHLCFDIIYEIIRQRIIPHIMLKCKCSWSCFPQIFYCDHSGNFDCLTLPHWVYRSWYFIFFICKSSFDILRTDHWYFLVWWELFRNVNWFSGYCRLLAYIYTNLLKLA